MTSPFLSFIAAALMVLYLTVIGFLAIYGFHRLWILWLYFRHYRLARGSSSRGLSDPAPRVTVQLPLYNEKYVIERLLSAACALDYPRDRLEVQVLDDSADETRELACSWVQKYRREGIDIVYFHRAQRSGFKAGALAYGLERAKGEFVAIFDADFLPPADFLKRALVHFEDPRVGMVQARWGHVNDGYSLLTALQAIFLDGHFLLEHTARNRSGSFFNFNGTAGVWRRAAIEQSGGWRADTLTEDLDLSYRAQLAGWHFVFLPDLVCPAELPVDIHAFKTQQHRWTAGAIQTARKVLPTLWRSDFPLRVKTEATFHLTGGLGYPLVALVSVLMPLSLLFRSRHPSTVNSHLEFGALAGTLISIFVYYAICLHDLYPDWISRVSRLPLLISLGAGMCWTNSRAVVYGFLGRANEFRRTAKYAIRERGERWRDKAYRSRAKRPALVEVFFSGYFLVALGGAWAMRAYGCIPFIVLFLFGNLYVAYLTFRHSFSGPR